MSHFPFNLNNVSTQFPKTTPTWKNNLYYHKKFWPLFWLAYVHRVMMISIIWIHISWRNRFRITASRKGNDV